MENNKQKKDALQRFIEVSEWVKRSTELGHAKESPDQQETRIKKAQKDYAYFVNYYFPHYATVKSAWFHIAAAKTILKHRNLRFVAPWFRGAAKSVHFDIIIPMFLKMQPERQIKTMVLVGKSSDSATTLLGDLMAELENNQRYIADFGEQQSTGDWQEGEFTTKDGTSFFALGRKQSPRGLRKKADRPDYIVFDDIDDDELVQNEARVNDLVDWVDKAVILSMDLGRGRVMFANNIIHEKSITAKMAEKYRNLIKLQRKKNAIGSTTDTHYEVLQVNIRDKDGNSNWPEKISNHEIDQLEFELGYAHAQTELYNNPISRGKVFNKEWMQYKKLPPINTYKSLIAYFDPGYKNTQTSDSMALILMGLTHSEYHVIKAYCDRVTRMGAVEWHYDLMDWLKGKNATAEFWMEELFMLDILYDDFDQAALEKGYPISVCGDTRRKPDKDLRIRSMSGAFERGKFFFNEAEKENHHMQNLEAQFLAFEPPKKTLKDGPDACEGAGFLLRQRVGATSHLPIIGRRPQNITLW